MQRQILLYFDAFLKALANQLQARVICLQGKIVSEPHRKGLCQVALDLRWSLLMTLLKKPGNHTKGLRQDFQNPSEVGVPVRLLNHGGEDYYKRPKKLIRNDFEYCWCFK